MSDEALDKATLHDRMQLNILVAQRLGWKVEQAGEWFFLIDPEYPTEPHEFQKGDADGLWRDVPDYCHNLSYAMSLIENIQYGIRYVIPDDGNVPFYAVQLKDRNGIDWNTSSHMLTLPYAIVRAWLLWWEMGNGRD